MPVLARTAARSPRVPTQTRPSPSGPAGWGALPRGGSVAARPALPHGARPGSYRRRGDSPSATGSCSEGPRPPPG